MTHELRNASPEGWEDLLNRKIQLAQSRLHTRAQFSQDLIEVVAHPLSPIAAVQIEIARPLPHDPILIGKPGDEGEPASFPVDNFDVSATCRIRTWYKVGGAREIVVDFPLITALFSDWVRAYWKGDARDGLTGLLWWQDKKLKDLLNTAVRDWLAESPLVSTFYADLDNFKKANDKFGQSKGDDVIRSFGALLERVMPEDAVVVRQGGDEFLIFIPTETPTDTLRLARTISSSVSTHEFETGDVKIGVAVGVSTGTRFDTHLSAVTLAERAEKGVKPGGDSTKLRGRVRFESQETVSAAPFTNQNRDLAAARVKTALLQQDRLGQPWLDLFSAEAEDAFGGDFGGAGHLRDSMDTLIDWAAPEWIPSITRLGTIENHQPDHSSALSRFDVAMAVAHGIYRSLLGVSNADVNGRELVVRYAADLSACELVLQPTNTTLFSIGESINLDDEISLGSFFTAPDAPSGSILGRRPVLVHIGYELPVNGLDQIFDEVILVDTRPTVSGGLPDFWASTVANVISTVDVNPNVPAIYVMGDFQHGQETLRKLTALNEGTLEPDRIEEKTGLSLRLIRRNIPRLKGHIFALPSLDAVYEHLVACLRDPYRFQLADGVDDKNRPILDRPLVTDKLGLTREDGCRVRTINEAFPTVLEITRRSNDSAILDQAGRSVRELIDFKVHLTSPLRDQIPDFYRDDEESFRSYFQKQFLEVDGLFGEWFQCDGQLELVLNHVAEVINEGHQFATRRAVLIIPHKTDDKTSPSPLGLISVRIIPRFLGEQVSLTFSYTWRTVEALVGFPYSLYGSVRFSQYLTEEVRRLVPEHRRGDVRMKDVSYVAHSLHFFVDEYGQQIARKIVNDATA